MAKLLPWEMGDSARRMVTKFNNLVSQVTEMSEFQQSVPPGVRDALKELSEELRQKLQLVDQKVDTLDKSSVGLDRVDNTSDMEKPVSTLQKQAISEAVNGALTDAILSRPVQEGEFSATEV